MVSRLLYRLNHTTQVNHYFLYPSNCHELQSGSSTQHTIPWNGIYIKLLNRDYGCGITSSSGRLEDLTSASVGMCESNLPTAEDRIKDAMKIQYTVYDITHVPPGIKEAGNSGNRRNYRNSIEKWTFKTQISSTRSNKNGIGLEVPVTREKLFIPCELEDIRLLIQLLQSREHWFNSPSVSEYGVNSNLKTNVLFTE